MADTDGGHPFGTDQSLRSVETRKEALARGRDLLIGVKCHLGHPAECGGFQRTTLLLFLPLSSMFRSYAHEEKQRLSADGYETAANS
jgi:hypothetical protein